MTGLERLVAALAAEDPALVGLGASGWLVALLTAALAIWQAIRADGVDGHVAEAAHELRGPLCAARLALGGLERAFPDAPSLIRGVAAIDLELDRAGAAIDDLVDAVAAPAGGPSGGPWRRRGPVDLAALATTAAPAWQALAEAHATTLELRTSGSPATVLGDSRYLLQAIENLVANACEHGRGRVRVTVVSDVAGARVEVSDMGDGPSAAVMRRTRWRARGRRRSRRPHRSRRGHGMVIAARVARENGGCLRARSDADGTVVSLELPSHRPSSRAVRRFGDSAIGPVDASLPGRPKPLAGAR